MSRILLSSVTFILFTLTAMPVFCTMPAEDIGNTDPAFSDATPDPTWDARHPYDPPANGVRKRSAEDYPWGRPAYDPVSPLWKQLPLDKNLLASDDNTPSPSAPVATGSPNASTLMSTLMKSALSVNAAIGIIGTLTGIGFGAKKAINYKEDQAEKNKS